MSQQLEQEKQRIKEAEQEIERSSLLGRNHLPIGIEVLRRCSR